MNNVGQLLSGVGLQGLYELSEGWRSSGAAPGEICQFWGRVLPAVAELRKFGPCACGGGIVWNVASRVGDVGSTGEQDQFGYCVCSHVEGVRPCFAGDKVGGGRIVDGGAVGGPVCGNGVSQEGHSASGAAVEFCDTLLGSVAGAGGTSEDVRGSFPIAENVKEAVASVDDKEKKGKNWKKNLKNRLKKKKGSGVNSSVSFSGSSKRSELASSFDDRRIAENKLATQKAEYQLRKNEYMTRSRVAEQQWETERLTCDQKLQKISEARFGSKPGFAETLVSANISSTSLPSLSRGTLSPDSSISVAEVNKMFKLIADLTAQVAQLTVESKAMKETAVLSAYEQRKLEMENMTFEQIAALRGTEKDIRPDGSPVKYDAIGQEIYSECGRPDFMNQYDYRSSITVSEDGQ